MFYDHFSARSLLAKLGRPSSKIKLGQFGVGSNIGQNHYLGHMKSYLVINGPNSYEKFIKYEIRFRLALVHLNLNTIQILKPHFTTSVFHGQQLF